MITFLGACLGSPADGGHHLALVREHAPGGTLEVRTWKGPVSAAVRDRPGERVLRVRITEQLGPARVQDVGFVYRGRKSRGKWYRQALTASVNLTARWRAWSLGFFSWERMRRDGRSMRKSDT